MARFRGAIGFSINRETSPGVYTEDITEKIYSGNVLRQNRSWRSDSDLLPTLHVENRISVVMDDFIRGNSENIRYVTYSGSKWSIKSIEIARPRIIFSLGDVYNGAT